MAGFSRSSLSQTGHNNPASTLLKICKVNMRPSMGREDEAGRNAGRTHEEERKKAQHLIAGK